MRESGGLVTAVLARHSLWLIVMRRAAGQGAIGAGTFIERVALVSLLAGALGGAACNGCGSIQMARRAPDSEGLPHEKSSGPTKEATLPHEGRDRPSAVAPDALRPAIPVIWNSWLAFDGTDAIVPECALAPDRTYRVFLDLAALDYSRFLPQAAAVEAGPRVRDLIGSPKHTVAFDVMLLPDDRYFTRPDNEVWTKRIQFHVRDVLAYQPSKNDDLTPFTADGARPYRFARTEFRVHTMTGLRRPTRAALGFSIWSEGRPVEELDLEAWIVPEPDGEDGRGEGCPPEWPVLRAGGGANAIVMSAREGRQGNSGLHILSLGPDQLWAVFLAPHQPMREALKWRVRSENLALFRGSVVATLQAITLASSEGLGLQGQALTGLLFDPTMPASAEARSKFEAAVASQILERRTGEPRPLLVYRSPFQFMIPLGFAALPVKGRKEHLGAQLSIEMPLPVDPVRPRADAACSIRWTSVLPPRPAPEDAPLTQGQDETLAKAHRQLGAHQSSLLRQWDTEPGCLFTDLLKFGTWVSAPEPTGATGLVILSHQDFDRDNASMLFLHPARRDALAPSIIRRTFGPGSIAVLNACGTGNPSALGFMDALSSHGVGAIVATATEVSPVMAADFEYSLASAIEKAPAPLPIGEAFDRAVDDLASPGGGGYGPRAFTYTLIGDRSLIVCAGARRDSCDESR